MEVGDSSLENLYYTHLDDTRTALPAGYPTDTTTSPYDYVADLSGADGSPKIGPGITLKVMAGDTFSIKVSSYYRLNGSSPQLSIPPPSMSISSPPTSPHQTPSYLCPTKSNVMDKNLTIPRRRFLGLATLSMAAAQFLGLNSLKAEAPNAEPPKSENSANPTSPGKRTPSEPKPFDTIKQIKTSTLDIGYVDIGPANARPILLLHGWPYDIHAFSDSADILAKKGYRVLIPHLRGHGTTTFLSANTVRNGQQSAIAADIIAFMDALHIEKAVIGGFDWGARTANIIAALWPNRCIALVSVSGYLIGSQQANKAPLPPKAELLWWYQFYFATERGHLGYQANHKEFAKLIWQQASPQWHFDDATFERSAASFENPDHVAIVIHNYRWRLAVAEGEGLYDEYEKKLAAFPVITVPSVTLEGDANGAPHPEPAAYKTKFTGKYSHHTITGGIGHNLPQEAPQAFADAVIEADGYAGH